jgi:hypothetical protein
MKHSTRLGSVKKDLFGKGSIYNKFNSVIDKMRERSIDKNITRVREEVAGL